MPPYEAGVLELLELLEVLGRVMGQLGRNSITSCGRCMVELPVGTRMI